MDKSDYPIALLICAALSACTEAPGCQKLLTLKITGYYPSYSVQSRPAGDLLVERPGLTPVRVDAEAIGRFCLRGPKDCNYATDQMLLELAGPR
jgi:hypothetical protein